MWLYTKILYLYLYLNILSQTDNIMHHQHPHQDPDTLALYLQKLKYQDSLLRIYDPGSKQHQLSEEVISFQKAQESLPFQTATYWTFFDYLKLTFCKNKRVPTYSQSCLEWCPGQNTATGRSSTGERSRLQSWVIEHSAQIIINSVHLYADSFSRKGCTKLWIPRMYDLLRF